MATPLPCRARRAAARCPPSYLASCDPEPRPARDFDPDMIARHAEISTQQVAILYRGTGRTAF
jgi:hypothetical protein